MPKPLGFVWAVLAAWAVASATAHAEEAGGTASQISNPYAHAIWYSTASDTEDLGGQISDLYRTLCKENALPLQEIVDSPGRRVELVMRDQAAFYGTAFPDQLDELLCAQNSAVCRSRRQSDHPTPVDIRCGSEVTKANLAKKPQWRNGPGSTLQLPNIGLVKEVRIQPVAIKKGTSVAQLLVLRREECESFKPIKCLDLIKQQNDLVWQKLLRRNYSGTVYLPALNVSVRLDLSTNLSLRDALKSQVSIPTDVQKHGQTSLVPAKDVADIKRHRSAVLLAAGFPSDVRSSGSATVGILDGWSDDKHCLIDYDLAKTHNLPRTVPASGVCGRFQSNFQAPEEHPTHLLGLVAATRSASGVGDSFSIAIAPGLHANAYQIETAPFNSKTVDDRLEKGSQGLALRDPSQIYVTSFTYNLPGTGDPFGDWVTRENRRSLTIAAAGRIGEDKRRQFNIEDPPAACYFHPACRTLDSPKVMSVVALTNDPGNPTIESSSRAGTVFDVGAPALDVPSTIRGGAVGYESGSSQAAAIVGVLAALIQESDQNLAPLQIRNRIISTSDIFPALSTQVWGGRINAARALDLSDDVVRVGRKAKLTFNGREIAAEALPRDIAQPDAHSPGNIVIHGAMDRICRQYLFKTLASGEEFPINAFQIQRLWRSRRDNQVWLFYEDQPKNQPPSHRVARSVVLDHETEGRRVLHLTFPQRRAGPAALDVPIANAEEIVARTTAKFSEQDWLGRQCK